jgi:hypothetical protein
VQQKSDEGEELQHESDEGRRSIRMRERPIRMRRRMRLRRRMGS